MEIKIRDNEDFEFSELKVTFSSGVKVIKGFTDRTVLSKDELILLIKLL